MEKTNEVKISKVMRIGKIKERHGGNIFIKTEFNNNRLSFTGVIGPLRNGDTRGGCGQIDMEFEHRDPADDDSRHDKLIKPEDIKFAPGWDRESWLDLLDIWEQWHLNDMRAGCKHQRAEGWGKKRLEVATYQLTPEVMEKRKAIKDLAIKRLIEGEKIELTKDEILILSLPYEQKDLPFPECYKEKSRETKTSNCVRETEHLEGVLMKACPVCGYKYGSTRLHEDVPESVLSQIKSWPDADKEPAWI